MEEEKIRDIILETIVTSLEAQLRAMRRLRESTGEQEPKPKGMSQIDMAEDILARAQKPLHISRIIDEIERIHGVRLDRESLVSALSKRVVREDRFVRTGKNTFALKGKWT
jgi:DNA-directed RNA polymerase delta subunit